MEKNLVVKVAKAQNAVWAWTVVSGQRVVGRVRPGCNGRGKYLSIMTSDGVRISRLAVDIHIIEPVGPEVPVSGWMPAR